MSIGRNAALLTATTVAGQLIQLGTLPLISAYAPPDAFGTYTFFAGFCAIASLFAGLRYEAAIAVARTDRQARMAAGLVSALGLACAGGVLLLAALVSHWFPAFGGVPTMELAVFAVAFLLFNTAIRAMSSWLNRLSRFGWIGSVQFAAVTGSVSLQIALLADSVQPAVALCLGYAGGQLIGALVGLCGPGRGAFRLDTLRRAQLRGTARHFISFPRYMILYGLSTNLRERAIQALVGWGAGSAALGQFAMAQRLQGAPHAFLHGGLGPALLSHARHSNKEEVAGVACALMELAVLVLAPIFVFVAVNSDALVSRFFTASWQGMHLYLRILSLAYLTMCCTAFLDRLYELYGTQRVALKVDLTYSAAVVAALTLAALSGSGPAMALMFALVFCIYELAWTYVTFSANQLPLTGLQRLGLLCIAYLCGLLALHAALLMLDELWQRALVAAVVSLAISAVHWRWMGGRHLVARLV